MKRSESKGSKNNPSQQSLDNIETAVQNQFTIYPNPTSSDFTVEFKLGLNNATLKVFSAEGKLVCHQNLKSGNQAIKVSTEGWSKGIYFIKVMQDETLLFEEKLTLQ